MSPKEMQRELKAWLAGIPGREWQHSLILSIGRQYVHYVSLYQGCRSGKIDIGTFYETKNLYHE